ncbi:MAG: FKBP-type peptidyl-prolyl cis-trans isomerase [Aeriscardovia sp.]|nr:FKBP-type peptidyl-prolyl cis-trans isomerase [Aeriscardovia sp.]
MITRHSHHSILKTIAISVASIVMCLSVAACGNSSASTLAELQGVTAKGESGKQPTVSFKKPMTIKENSYAVLIKGTGQQLQSGDRVCTQDITYNARTGAVIDSTWTKNTPVCTLVLNSNVKQSYLNIFEAQKVGATIAFGIPGTNTSTSNTNNSSSSSSSSVANASDSYITALTIVSVSKDLDKAQGTKVTNIPADLPKVTFNSDGVPTSINMNNYKSNGKLVSQDLIQGNGATLTANDTAVVKYSGWILSNGKEFNSDWKNSVDFQLSNTIKGFQQGLVGKKVGSQVLLVIPPDLGYGSTSNNGIPANSTLVFVVDILGAYKN